jgi:hypothetical protein
VAAADVAGTATQGRLTDRRSETKPRPFRAQTKEDTNAPSDRTAFWVTRQPTFDLQINNKTVCQSPDPVYGLGLFYFFMLNPVRSKWSVVIVIHFAKSF